MNARAIIPVFLPQAGCPQPPCIFCNQKILSDLDEVRTAEEVKNFVFAAIESLDTSRYRNVEVAFYSGSFTALPVEIQKEYLQTIKNLQTTLPIASIRISTRPDYITTAILQMLGEHGVESIELGIQSFDDETLRLSNRGYTAEAALRAARMVRDHGFNLYIHIMTGLPGDTPEKSFESARITVELQPAGVRIHPVWVLFETPLEALFDAGEFTPWDADTTVATLAAMITIFEDAGITVVRVGLQPSRRLIMSNAVRAGFHHHALRELCDAYIVAAAIAERIISDYNTKKEYVHIALGQQVWRRMIAHDKIGYSYLRKMLPEEVFFYCTCDPSSGDDDIHIERRDTYPCKGVRYS